MDKIIVDHTNRASLVELANLIRSTLIHPVLKVEFSAALVEADLMRMRFTGTGFIGRAVGFLIGNMDGEKRKEIFRKLADKDERSLDPKYVKDANKRFEEGISHLIDGKDAFDPRSAGGFSGPELEKFRLIAARFGIEFEIGKISHEEAVSIDYPQSRAARP